MLLANVHSAWTPIWNALLRALGQRCQICATVLPQPTTTLLCPDCTAQLAPRQAGYCPHCGICAADAQALSSLCPTCRSTPPLWSTLVMHGPYCGLLKELIHRHKFNQDHGVSRLLGDMLCAAWTHRNPPRPDFIVPVPLRTNRLLRRGFNQSLELGRMLARHVGCSVHAQGLRKVRDTQVQSSLGRTERLRNVYGAFTGTSDMRGKRVLIVDDVITTGATLTACAEACRQSGAQEIAIAVLARAQ